MCQRMDIKNRKRKRKKNFVFFLRSPGDTSIEKRKTKKKKKRGKRDYDSYMIRVGSVNDCCCCDVTGREATAVSKNVDGVLDGDSLLLRSGEVTSEV